MTTTRISTFLISISAAVAIGFFLLVLNKLAVEGTFLDRLVTLLGGDFPSGIIQLCIYFLFVFGIVEIKMQNDHLKRESRAFQLRILPEKENWVLSPDDVARIKLAAIERNRKEPFMLLQLIKNACTKYRSNKSASEALEVVSAQVRILQANAESEQYIIRYIAWAIPSVGFIGTIIGIANSLGYAKLVGEADGLEKVTGALNVAFDTTLVALFLSIFLVLGFNLFQEKAEKLFSKMEIYVIDNLINRIYNR